MNKKGGALGLFPWMIIRLLLYGLILAYPLMLLLNYVLAPTALGFLFGSYLTFWKTFALLVIVKYLF